jgi:site-specific recombinase XerD
LFSKQAANSLVTETSQYFVFFCRSVCSANLAKCLIINVLRLIIVILFFIAFLNITYTARHTWATLAFHSGQPVGIISQALGHSSLRVTETYLKPFGNELVDKANRQLIASVRKCKWKNETEYRAGL